MLIRLVSACPLPNQRHRPLTPLLRYAAAQFPGPVGPCPSSNVSEPLLFPVASQNGRKTRLSLTTSAQASLRLRPLDQSCRLVTPLDLNLTTLSNTRTAVLTTCIYSCVSTGPLPCHWRPLDRFTTPRIGSSVNKPPLAGRASSFLRAPSVRLGLSFRFQTYARSSLAFWKELTKSLV